MERGWDRAHRFVDLPAGELERLVGAALPGARLCAARPLTSGLRNSNYRVDLVGTAPVLLRLYTADPEACGREAGVLAAMAGRGPAPRVLHSEGTADPQFALLEWMDGDPLDVVLRDCDSNTANELARACGSTLAAIHGIRFPTAGFLGPRMRVIRAMPAWDAAVLATLAGPVEERLGRELSNRVRSTVETNARALEPIWQEAVLVHADYKPWNLLVGRAGGATAGDVTWLVTGIIDWEFACAGCKLIDFATFLRGDSGRLPGFANAFAEAYVDAGGTLPADWRRLTRLVDLLNLMQLLAWTDDRAAVELRRLVADTLTGLEPDPGRQGSRDGCRC